VFICALADIMAGEELFIDYLLDVKGRRTAGCQKAACVDAARGTAAERCSPGDKLNTAFGDRRTHTNSRTHREPRGSEERN
jgi:hypothetical protein